MNRPSLKSYEHCLCLSLMRSVDGLQPISKDPQRTNPEYQRLAHMTTFGISLLASIVSVPLLAEYRIGLKRVSTCASFTFPESKHTRRK